jgi:hypothetical protein
MKRTALSFSANQILVNTTFGPVYNATSTFDVTAGTGEFDGSLVAPTLAAYKGNISLWTLATSSTFLNNPQYSKSINPIRCSAEDDKCESYLLPGGLQSIVPNPPLSSLEPIVLVHDSPACQVEFVNVSKGRHRFSAGECILYGNSKYRVAVQFCLAHDTSSPGSIVAGEYG